MDVTTLVFLVGLALGSVYSGLSNSSPREPGILSEQLPT